MSLAIDIQLEIHQETYAVVRLAKILDLSSHARFLYAKAIVRNPPNTGQTLSP